MRPCAATRPSRSTTTASQVRSTSSSTCEENSTRMPRSRESRRTSSSISSRPCGSRPFVGSSSTTSSGECTSAWASLTRWRMPVENVPIRREALLLEPDLEQHLARPQHRDPARQAAQLAQVHHEVARGHPAGQALVLGHVADAPPQLEAARDGVDAEQPGRARVGLDEAEQRAHQRRLAGAVGAQQPDRAVRELEAHVVERDDVVVALGQARGGDRRTLGGRCHIRNRSCGGREPRPGRHARGASGQGLADAEPESLEQAGEAARVHLEVIAGAQLGRARSARPVPPRRDRPARRRSARSPRAR